MQDTTPEFQRMVDERYRRLTPAERVRMCTEMFNVARMLVDSSLPHGLEPIERRRRIAERFYGEFGRKALADL